MSACIVCGAECPPRRPGHNGGGRPRVLCGAPPCRRARGRVLQRKARGSQRYVTGTSHEYARTLKTLRQACRRRKLKLKAGATATSYVVAVYAGRKRLHSAQGKALEAIAAARAWLYATRPGRTQRLQARSERVREAQPERRMTAADYAWGAA